MGAATVFQKLIREKEIQRVIFKYRSLDETKTVSPHSKSTYSHVATPCKSSQLWVVLLTAAPGTKCLIVNAIAFAGSIIPLMSMWSSTCLFLRDRSSPPLRNMWKCLFVWMCMSTEISVWAHVCVFNYAEINFLDRS